MPIVVNPSLVATPAPITDSTSLDGLIRAVTDIVWDGVLIKVDYSSMSTTDYVVPFQARIYRINPDGSEELVRSGDPVMSYDKVGFAYDHEAAIGRAAGYYAVPVMADGTDGPPSNKASVYVTMPAGTYDDPGLWAKCLDDPAKSMRLRLKEWRSGKLPGRLTRNTVLNNPFIGLTPDVRGGRETTMTVLTDGQDEYDQLENLINAGPILLQNKPGIIRRDMYAMVDDVDFNRAGDLVTSTHVYWTLNLLEQERPPTVGQFLRVPGKSFADREMHYPTFGDTTLDGHNYGDNLLAV